MRRVLRAEATRRSRTVAAFGGPSPDEKLASVNDSRLSPLADEIREGADAFDVDGRQSDPTGMWGYTARGGNR